MIEKVFTFLDEFNYEEIPKVAKENAIRSFLDIIGVAASATQTELSKIIRSHTSSFYIHNPNIGKSSSIWFDGSKVNSIGATLANAMTIDALDAHDGQKLTKGHVGCGLIPSLIAAMEAEANKCSIDFLRNLIIGYEIGTRAGISLHQSAKDYHTSGAWIPIACAAIVSNVLKLNKNQTREALGIAEFYGPRSQMMRCIDHPSMVKDGSGWGAMAGINAVYLAKSNFTGSPAILIEDKNLSHIWSDLGSKWYINEQYLKLYPVCRWSQPAVEASLDLQNKYGFHFNEIDKITINTFHEAKRLEKKHPKTTEEAQYSLPHPLAVALIFGNIGAEEVSIEFINNSKVANLREKINVCEETKYNNLFPGKRFADAEIKLKNGIGYKSRPTEAKGDPENPLSNFDLEKKFQNLTIDILGKDRSNKIYENIKNLEEIDNIEEIFKLISNPIS